MDDSSGSSAPSRSSMTDTNISPDAKKIIENGTTGNNSYSSQILKSGLTAFDVEYFNKTFENLESVKLVKFHCTSCDIHIGSAPKDVNKRYEHPLLKVLVCHSCFIYYSSGDFEKDEDGSEMYCRWCGEGGQVFCCTKCPYVFCGKCIRRNLGRAAAKQIQNSDNWMCFACNPSQLSVQRAGYWAVQKYAEEMLQKLPENDESLSEDASICCSLAKKRPDTNKLKVYTGKRKRTESDNSLLKATLKKPTQLKASTNLPWQSSPTIVEPEAEVICTPDIIPLDDSSPHNSPKHMPTPSASVPYVIQQSVPVPTMAPIPNLHMPQVRPGMPQTMSMTDFQRHLQSSLTRKLVFTPQLASDILRANNNNQAFGNAAPRHVAPVLNSQDGVKIVFNQPGSNTFFRNQNYTFATFRPNASVSKTMFQNASSAQKPTTAKRFSIAPKSVTVQNASIAPKPASNPGTSVVLNPVTGKNASKLVTLQKSGSVRQFTPVPKLLNAPASDQTTADQPREEDWFDFAIVECAEITEYISSKISGLANIHSKAYKSQKLMEELHNTLQTYLFIAVEKIHKMKNAMRSRYEEQKQKDESNRRFMNPYALGSEERGNASASDENSNSSRGKNTKGAKKVRKMKNILKQVASASNIQPDEVIFDMDVTNASDEEGDSSKSNSRCTSAANTDDNTRHGDESENETMKTDAPYDDDDDDDVQIIEKKEEIIDLVDSSDDNMDEEELLADSVNLTDLFKDAHSRINIKNISKEELKIYLSATVRIENPSEAQTVFDAYANNKGNVVSQESSDDTNKLEVVDKNTSKLEDDPVASQEENETQNNESNKETEVECNTKDKPSNVEGKSSNEIEEFGDIEEMLNESVVLRCKDAGTGKSFGDEFSKFIDKDKVDDNHLSDADEDITDSLIGNTDIAKELDAISDINNADNSSLSLPPSSLDEEYMTEKSETKLSSQEQNETAKQSKNVNGDLSVESEILTLKQMAENCINTSVDVAKASTECTN